MRFTVTIEAPEPCNALQGLANLPEGWRVVEYREVPKVPSLADYLPTIGLSNPKDAFVVSPLKDAILQDDARRFNEMVERSRTICGEGSPIHGASIGKAIVSGNVCNDSAKDIASYLNPNTAILKDGTLRPLVHVQHGPSELQEPHAVHFMQEKAWGWDEAKGKDRTAFTLNGIPIVPSPAVTPDTIVALNPDGTIAGAAKIDTNSQP